MKKLLLSLLACGTVVAAQAQAGSILVFGDLGIHTTADTAKEPNRTFAFNITPGVGYQFNKNWTAGIFLHYDVVNFKPGGTPSIKSGERTYGGGLFGRYSCPIGEHFFIFGQAQAGYFSSRATLDGEGVDHTGESGFGVALFPAVGVNVCHGFALNFGFGGVSYLNQRHEDSDNGYSNFDLTFGQQFNLGISKNFGGKKMKGHHGMMDDTRHVDANDDEEEAPKKKKASRDDDDE